MNAIKLVSSAVLLALTTFACAPPEPGDASASTAAGSEDAPVGQTRSALTSSGFTCGPHGCACDPTVGPEDPFFNCDGIDKVCKAMGSPKTCGTDQNGNQYCRCLFLVAAPLSPVLTSPSPIAPVAAASVQ